MMTITSMGAYEKAAIVHNICSDVAKAFSLPNSSPTLYRGGQSTRESLVLIPSIDCMARQLSYLSLF
jgi:hypothetical protein